MILCYDFEVFKHDWLVVIIDLFTGKETSIINDMDAFENFYEEHKHYIWCGYNSRTYDMFIAKSILLGYNPYEMSKWLIEDERKGFEFDKRFNDIEFYNFDVRWSTLAPSLKTLEAWMGSDIRETEIPFDIDRKLTDEEIESTLKYCRHDVEETVKVMCKSKNEFLSSWDLIKEFDLPLSCINKTKAQNSAIILNCVKKNREDEWDYEIEDFVDVNKYKEVLEWFNAPENRTLDEKRKLEIKVAGVPHTFGLGGLHGAVENKIYEGRLINVDVQSFYPSLMIEWDMLSRNSKTPEKFKQIYDKRISLKKAGKKKEQAPLKIVLNGTYGASGDKYNALFDPRQAHRICVTGQLLLLDLIEKIEPYCEIIQSNTDGILFKVETDDQEKKCLEIAEDWQRRTKMVFEFENYVKIVQSNVNNYLLVPEGSLYDDKGKPRWKAKGAIVKHLSELDYDLAIVNRAVVNWYLQGITPEKTIQDCDELMDFMSVKKVSSLYKDAYQGCTFREESVINESTGRKKKVKVWNEDGTRYTEKTFRVFATKEPLGCLYKHKEGKSPEKFANCPENCRVVNTNIVGAKCKDNKWLDKEWYINEAWHRIKLFMGEK